MPCDSNARIRNEILFGTKDLVCISLGITSTKLLHHKKYISCTIHGLIEATSGYVWFKYPSSLYKHQHICMFVRILLDNDQ